MAELSAREFRRILGRFATGVTVVLAQGEDGLRGMTANAFMSVSLNPLLVALGVHRQGRMAELVGRIGCPFTVSVLAHDQQDLAEHYSRPGPLRIAPEPTTLLTDADGSVIKGAAAWLFCRTEEVVPAGDHWLIVASVGRGELDVMQSPLVFYAGRYWEQLDREHDNPWEWQLFEL
jgi:flavin reductase (DIM6/NTAB) family NADH-FMN oxidoreductase RutF